MISGPRASILLIRLLGNYLLDGLYRGEVGTWSVVGGFEVGGLFGLADRGKMAP